jgi:hypothetical protein
MHVFLVLQKLQKAVRDVLGELLGFVELDFGGGYQE